ncbi:hypothetical protein BGX38DRAFT_1186268, partial [Terfezia claveryi]
MTLEFLRDNFLYISLGLDLALFEVASCVLPFLGFLCNTLSIISNYIFSLQTFTGCFIWTTRGRKYFFS